MSKIKLQSQTANFDKLSLSSFWREIKISLTTMGKDGGYMGTRPHQKINVHRYEKNCIRLIEQAVKREFEVKVKS